MTRAQWHLQADQVRLWSLKLRARALPVMAGYVDGDEHVSWALLMTASKARFTNVG